MADLERLRNASLPRVAGRTPDYPRDRLRAGVVHLGIGAFHRAHQAVYLDDLLRADPRWAVVGVSLRRDDTARALTPQDGLYTMAVGDRYRVIGSVQRVLSLPKSPREVLAALVDPAVHMVSLTVTEKGYGFNPATGALDTSNADIAADLAAPAQPRSAVGLLVYAIEQRRRRRLPPLTVLSCDNVARNGAVLRALVEDFAQRVSPGLCAHVARDVAFPSSMVDRIVPATTDFDRERVSAAIAVRDRWPVITEPFSQWVLEDSFAGARPALENVGVQLVADVRPYELMKLRMLNASHSAIAYLGCLAGYQSVSEAVGDPRIERYLRALMQEEIVPVLDLPPECDPATYCDALLARFKNPAIRHRTAQIAMDGSQKLPPRVLDTVRARWRRGLPCDRLLLIVAAWIRCLGGRDERGVVIAVDDPLGTRLKALAAEHRADPRSLAAAVCRIEDVFGADLAADAAFRSKLADATANVQAAGAIGALMAL